MDLLLEKVEAFFNIRPDGEQIDSARFLSS